jgi:hypothetical protein
MKIVIVKNHMEFNENRYSEKTTWSFMKIVIVKNHMEFHENRYSEKPHFTYGHKWKFAPFFNIFIRCG